MPYFDPITRAALCAAAIAEDVGATSFTVVLDRKEGATVTPALPKYTTADELLLPLVKTHLDRIEELIQYANTARSRCVVWTRPAILSSDHYGIIQHFWRTTQGFEVEDREGQMFIKW